MRIQRQNKLRLLACSRRRHKVAFKKRHIPILVGRDVTYLISPYVLLLVKSAVLHLIVTRYPICSSAAIRGSAQISSIA